MGGTAETTGASPSRRAWFQTPVAPPASSWSAILALFVGEVCVCVCVCMLSLCVQKNTSAVVGVKAELGAPDPTTPNAGKIEFFVDW